MPHTLEDSIREIQMVSEAINEQRQRQEAEARERKTRATSLAYRVLDRYYDSGSVYNAAYETILEALTDGSLS